jgi:hypothetical protein
LKAGVIPLKRISDSPKLSHSGFSKAAFLVRDNVEISHNGDKFDR